MSKNDLKKNPLVEKAHRPLLHHLVNIKDFLIIPIIVYFLLNKRRLHADFQLSYWKKLRLGYKVFFNSKKVYTGTAFQAHLAMIQKILSIPKKRPGVVVECGCFRGGTTANLSLACEITGRKMFVYDSFEGLPEAHEDDLYPGTKGVLAADIEQVRAHVTRNGYVDCCTFVKGYFEDTLPHHKEKIAFIFLDVDYQSSLLDCILNLWPKLTRRGYLFTDEYVYTDFCALFYSEKFWKKYFNTTPPGLLGAGSGIPLGTYYTGPPFWSVYNRPQSIAFTRKDWSGYWNFYPDEPENAGENIKHGKKN